MIPSTIHYCWFGDKEPSGELQKECLQTWTKLDSYRIIKWDETNCDIHENAFVARCYAEGKYAFVSDYFRLKALYEYGGIYLDTDVYIEKPFDDLLGYDFFAGFIYDYSIGTAVIGAKAQSELIGNALKDYQEMQSCIVNNNLFTHHVKTMFSALVFNGKTQYFKDKNAIILSKSQFESGKIVGTPYCIHMCDGSWWRKNDKKKEQHNKLKLALVKTPIINVLAIIKWCAAKKKKLEQKQNIS